MTLRSIRTPPGPSTQISTGCCLKTVHAKSIAAPGRGKVAGDCSVRLSPLSLHLTTYGMTGGGTRWRMVHPSPLFRVPGLAREWLVGLIGHRLPASPRIAKRARLFSAAGAARAEFTAAGRASLDGSSGCGRRKRQHEARDAGRPMAKTHVRKALAPNTRTPGLGRKKVNLLHHQLSVLAVSDWPSASSRSRVLHQDSR